MANRDYNVLARLLVGGEPVPLSSFRVSATTGAIGATLRCELADPAQTIDETADVTFEIGLGFAGAVEWVALVDLGRLRSLDESVGWLSDSRSINAACALARKWDISPARPIILYDPAQVDSVTTASGSLDDLVDSNHALILPERIEVRSLDLIQLLNFVYVQRLGFSRVVTNLANFQIPTVSISMTETFHAAAAREVALFEPVYHSDDSGTLFLVDPQGRMPDGLDARKLQLKNYARIDTTREVGRLINAVILSYRDNLSGASVGTIRSETEMKEVGAFNSDDWQRSVTTRFFLDFREDPDHPDRVTRSVATRVRTEVTARADGAIRLVAVDDQTDQYKYDYRLKTGYVKEVSVYTRAPNESARLRLVQRETNQISWDELSSRPGEFLKRYEVTQISGAVLKTQDDPLDESTIARQSLYVANRLNDIPDEAELELDRAISTQIDTYRVTGTDQIEVNSQKINHLVSQAAPQSTNTFQHTGTIIAGVRPQAATVNMLIEADGVSDDARRPPVRISAGNIPFVTAREIAGRMLARRGTQPTALTGELAGLDLSLRRGSIRKVHDRAGNVRKVFITGYEIAGEQLGTPQFRYAMTFQGVVIE